MVSKPSLIECLSRLNSASISSGFNPVPFLVIFLLVREMSFVIMSLIIHEYTSDSSSSRKGFLRESY